MYKRSFRARCAACAEAKERQKGSDKDLRNKPEKWVPRCRRIRKFINVSIAALDPDVDERRDQLADLRSDQPPSLTAKVDVQRSRDWTSG